MRGQFRQSCMRAVGEGGAVAAVTVLEHGVMSDAVLLRGAKAGDAEAFAVLYARHRDCAWRMARRLARSKSSAEDLVSDTFARIWKAVSNGHGPTEAFAPYMATVLRRVASDQWQREGREVPVETVPDLDFAESFDVSAALSDRAMVQNAFRSLPEKWQAVLWHTEVEGRSPSEMAVLLGVPAKTVSMTAFRAREGMREAFLREHLQDAPSATCGGVVELLAGYVRDSLSNRDRAKVDGHVGSCESCSSVLGEARVVNQTLRSALWPSALAGSGLWATLLKFRPRPSAAAAVSAAAVVGLVAGAAAMRPDDVPQSLPQPVATTQVVVGTSGGAAGDGGDGGVGGHVPVEVTVQDVVVPPLTPPPVSSVPAASGGVSGGSPIGVLPVSSTTEPSTSTTGDAQAGGGDAASTTLAPDELVTTTTSIGSAGPTTTLEPAGATTTSTTTTSTTTTTTTTVMVDAATTTTALADETTTTVAADETSTSTSTTIVSDPECDLTILGWCIDMPW